MWLRLLFLYFMALWEIFSKVWHAPDRMKAFQSLSHSERFVLALTIAIVLVCVKQAVAL